MNPFPTREQCVALDVLDPLRSMRELFSLPLNKIYLNGNSLGPLPKRTSERVMQVIREEWGDDLITSWNRAGWIDLSMKIGNKIARLVGAGENEILVADSTSINLYKVLYSALMVQKDNGSDRRVVVSEADNFPSDNYIARAVCDLLGAELRLVAHPHELEGALDSTVAALMLTEVNYRTAFRHNMEYLTRMAHGVGALTIWDLAHSAGALPVDLKGSDVDYAVGCGYKFLCGGPGAPAFVWVNPDRVTRSSQPLTGWLGHRNPFRFSSDYQAADGIVRFQCGTPPILSMAALECGVDTILEAEALGGMGKVYEKAKALTSQLTSALLGKSDIWGVRLISPENPHERGSQVSLSLEGDLADKGYPIAQALIARGVTVDFRGGDPSRTDRPDILRFGITPLTLGAVDIFDAINHFWQVLENGEWRRPCFMKRERVT